MDVLGCALVVCACEKRVACIPVKSVVHVLNGADPPFLGIDWSYIISPRECCVLNSVTVHGEAGRWKSAVEAAVDIMSSLVKFGLVQTELDRYKSARTRPVALIAGIAGLSALASRCNTGRGLGFRV